jgi:hypothetical protein
MNKTELLSPFLGENVQISDSKIPNATLFYYINDAAGNLRWVFPKECKVNTLLALYNSAGWRGQIRVLAYRLAFAAKMQNKISSGSFWAVCKEENLDFAVFTGTPGRNRKMVISYQSHFFEKIGLTPEAQLLTQKEGLILEEINGLNLQKMQIPNAKTTQRGGLIQNSVKPSEVIATAQLTERHYSALQELFEQTKQSNTLKNTFFYQKIKENCLAFEQCESNEFKAKSAKLYAKIQQNLVQLENENPTMMFGKAHGDFTPWNCFLPSNPSKALAVYDWELSLLDAPEGFDALHFTLQSGILLQRLPLEKLHQAALGSTKKATNATHLLPLYLIFTASYYLPLYARQVDLHAQVWWLLEAWEYLLDA